MAVIYNSSVAGKTAVKSRLIEFISGTGVVIDGTVYTSGGPWQVSGGTSGPWNLTAPLTLVGPVYISGTGGGAGGGAGANDAVNAAGGGGGGPGGCTRDTALVIWPGDNFTVTLGAAGTGGVKGGANATSGGNTTLINNTVTARDPAFPAGVYLVGGPTSGAGSGAAPTAGVSQTGTAAGNAAMAVGIVQQGGAGGANTGGGGGTGNIYTGSFNNAGMGTGGGGGGSNSAGTAGNGGGPNLNGISTAASFYNNTLNIYSGTASGNLAGGGGGGYNHFNLPGKGGNGGVAGGNAIGKGGGGGGGGGNANGGNGGVGYLRLVATY